MEKQMKPEESIKIIQSMIETEKTRFNENGFIYLFWGWMVVAAALLQYALMYFGVQQHYYAWMLMIIGGIYTGVYYSKAERKPEKSVMPLLGKVMGYLWATIGLNIFIVAFLLPFIVPEWITMAQSWLLFIILAFIGVATVVSGALLRFKPLVLGGIACNVLAFIGIYVSMEYWGLISILAIVFSDLVPGYILRAKYKKQSHV